MKVNKKTIYSSIEATRDEVDFCNKILEIAEDISLEKKMDKNDCLVDIIYEIAHFNMINFEDWG